jgi:tripartite-type tricarboxylate transporter receptor subunit TctC
MENPEVAKVIKNTGVIPVKMRAEETKKQMADEREHFTNVMTKLNLIKK